MSPGDTLVSVFEEQARCYPDRMAVVYEGEGITYGELDRRSSVLAMGLIKAGVEEEGLVGLMVGRGIGMIVGIMGILRAGGAYLPIDVKMPVERGLYMLRSAGAKILLTEGSYGASYGEHIRVLGMGSVLEESVGEMELPGVEGSGRLAYCIFTSGSTGQPKGVLIEQGSVVNLIRGLSSRIYSLLGGDGLRVGLLASHVFDASVQQIFGALLQGHTLYIAGEEERMDGWRMREFFDRHRIEVTDGTPTHLRLLVGAMRGGEELRYLRGWILAGEVLPVGLVREFWEKVGGEGPRLWNVYGPTEACVDTTCYEVERSGLERYSFIPIGRPLANQRVYIMDREGQLSPVGVTGELCIGGAGLARGYAGEEARTADRFVERQEGEGRVYRTGDLARWLPEGELEYRGRKDTQVKVRGYRIELGEIEQQLLRQEGVREAVVIVRGEEGERYLAAYYTGEERVPAGGWRERLSASLPEYMLPAIYIRMERWPLTTSGKLDVGSLPEVEWREETDRRVGPANGTEEQLVEIWAEVLKLDRNAISTDKSFLELGGHSLSAIQIANRIKKSFSTEIKLMDMFQRQTVRQQAEFITTNEWLHRGASTVSETKKFEIKIG